MLFNQKAKQMNPKDYKSSEVKELDNGVWIVHLRKRYDEDWEKVMPLLEEKRLTKWIIKFLHKTG